MLLLQNPLRSLDQIEWYLDHHSGELFPGAYLLAAGNLARQVLEQILFILAFYSGLSRSKFIRRDGRLRQAHQILEALRKPDPSGGTSYFGLARRRGPRVRKFARYPRSLDLWRRTFNEPSHFSNPIAVRKLREETLRAFVSRLRSIMDHRDAHLLTAAINEIRSGGKIRAHLCEDANNTPGIIWDVVVGPRNLVIENGRLALKGPETSFQVVPDDRVLPIRWTRRPVLVKHSKDIAILLALVNRNGQPVNVKDPRQMLEDLIVTKRDAEVVTARLKKLGLRVERKTCSNAHVS